MASDRTNERRERVLEMLAKSDRAIAKELIRERFFGAVPRNADDRARHLDNARRTVGKDRAWWRGQWKALQAEKITPADSRADVEEFIARLKSRLNDVEEVLDDALVKSTPRVQAIDAAVKIEIAIARARGSDVAPERPADAVPPPIALGVILGTKNVSPEMKQRLRKQGVEID